MTDTSCVVILYVVFFAVYLVYGETKSQTFYMYAGKRCVSKSASLTARSNIGCCRACLEVDTCKMVSFNTSSKTCELSETDTENTDALATETGWNVFYKKKLGCLPDWVAYEDKCLYLDTQLRNRNAALVHCVSLESSAHLVNVKTEALQLFIIEWLRQESPDGHVWLGGMFDSASEEYYWTDGTPFGYTHWRDGEPNLPDIEFCVGALGVLNSQWFDAPCSNLYHGVCEYTLN